ncbi:MAG: hypothetical protein ACT4QC_15650 [Planctomycetaceae bacterium]
MKVILKDRQLVFVPEDALETDELAAWKLLHAGHVLAVEHNEGTGASLVDLGDREIACREPINVTSGHADEAIRLIGNFATTPFVLDGQVYQSIEGFWQSLKFDEGRERREVAALDGPAAKRRGADRGYGQHVEYAGQPIAVGTTVHWDLMRRAVRAKFEQNALAREALLSTGDRPLEHRVRHDSRTIPGVIMADIWMRLRAELRKCEHSGQLPRRSTAAGATEVAQTGPPPGSVPILAPEEQGMNPRKEEADADDLLDQQNEISCSPPSDIKTKDEEDDSKPAKPSPN